MEGDKTDDELLQSSYSEKQKINMNNIAAKLNALKTKGAFLQSPQYKEITINTLDDYDNIKYLRNYYLNMFGSLEPDALKDKNVDDNLIIKIIEIDERFKEISALKTLKQKEDLERLIKYNPDNDDIASNNASGGNANKQYKNKKGAKQNIKPTKPIKPVKPTITGKKEILGKERCIYKKAGDRKEYVKYKGDLITVKDYKKIISVKKTKK
jgi:hypothetical protein